MSIPKEISYKHQCRASSKKINATASSEGGLQQDLNLPTRSCHAWTPRRFHQDLHRIFSPEIKKTWTKTWMPGPLRQSKTRSQYRELLLLVRILSDLDTRTFQEPFTTAFIQAPPIHGSCKIWSSCKDLLERLSTESAQDLRLRTCTRSCKDL